MAKTDEITAPSPPEKSAPARLPEGSKLARRTVLCAPPAAAASLLAQRAQAQPTPTAVILDVEWETPSTAEGTEFAISAYESMRDDVGRTPLFVEAIKRRMRGKEGQLAVVDIGTGPFAIFAIAAARAGARKVYAIEADPQVAELARKVVSEAKDIPQGVIEIVEGYSTSVSLPEKVDLLVAEVIGSVASEEGVFRTVRDAQRRFLLKPEDEKSYIPCRVQTLAAPASYAFHYMIAAEGRQVAGLVDESGPLRLNCQDQYLALMAPPQVWEDFRYNDASLVESGMWKSPTDLSFEFTPTILQENTRKYKNTLGFEGVLPKDAKMISEGVARGFSGVALWPKLILDPEGDLVVEARGSKGQAQKSHWQTILPLMSKFPLSLTIGDVVRFSGMARFDDKLPPIYSLHVEISK